MSIRIRNDHARFKDIVRGKIKQNLKDYVKKGELIGKQGKDTITIPVPRIDLTDFTTSTVQVLNLTDTDPDLKGFMGGFTDGQGYGYFVPYHNGVKFGKLVRVDLSDFKTVDIVDLEATDTELRGFWGGFTVHRPDSTPQRRNPACRLAYLDVRSRVRTVS